MGEHGDINLSLLSQADKFPTGRDTPADWTLVPFDEEAFGNAGLQTQGTEGEAPWATALRALPTVVWADFLQPLEWALLGV